MLMTAQASYLGTARSFSRFLLSTQAMLSSERENFYYSAETHISNNKYSFWEATNISIYLVCIYKTSVG